MRHTTVHVQYTRTFAKCYQLNLNCRSCRMSCPWNSSYNQINMVDMNCYENCSPSGCHNVVREMRCLEGGGHDDVAREAIKRAPEVAGHEASVDHARMQREDVHGHLRGREPPPELEREQDVRLLAARVRRPRAVRLGLLQLHVHVQRHSCTYFLGNLSIQSIRSTLFLQMFALIIS